MEGILERIGYKYEKLRLGGILIRKNRRKLYVEVAGKNLPYLVRYGEEAFPWESHIYSSAG